MRKSFRLSNFSLLNPGLGLPPVPLSDALRGFGRVGVGPVSGPTAQHIVTMAPVPPD